MMKGKDSYFGFLERKGFNLPEYIYMNYFWILTVGGLFWVATKQAWLDTTFIPLLIYYLLFAAKGKIKTVNIFDILWIICYIWGIFTWLVNDYPHQGIMIIRCLSEQMAYMMAYWLVRKNEKLNVQTIVKAACLPLLITTILGIYLFYTEPAWYAARTKDFTTDFEEFEFKRLRSIWMDGYILMYFCTIVVIYELFQIGKGLKEKKWEHYLMAGMCILAIFLGIQRSSIVSITAAMVVVFFYSLKFNNAKRILGIGLIVLLGAVIFVVGITRMEGEQQIFYAEKIFSMTQDGSNLASERLFLNQQQGGLGFVGDGIGRHNMYADKYPPNFSMRDGEYIKLLTEQGYIGFVFYGLLIGLALLKCVKHFKYLGFEFAILLMLLISMIGANPLSTGDKHPLIYWMIIGQIANFNIKKEKYGKRKVVNTHSNI